MNESMPHWLTKQAYLSPHKIAIETIDGQTLTFSQLHKKSKIFARKIASLGIGKHSKVAILSNNHLDMAIVVHALTYLKAVAVMLNTRLTKQELNYQLEQSGAELVLTTEELRHEKELTFSEQKTYAEIYLLSEKDIELASHIHLHDPFTMMFTSGTTGHPKGVMHSYGNHWWSAISSSLNLGLERNDKWLLTLPIFHVGGLSILLKSIIYGIPVLLLEKYDPKQFYEAIMTKDVTIISLVTIMLKRLLDYLDENSLPPTVRCLLLGGGSVPEPLLHLVKEKKIPLFQSYGMTETSSQIVTLSAEDSLRKLGSAGKPLFPAEIKITKKNDEGIGEIEVKGPMVMEGYFNNEEANVASFRDGWLKTGDLGYIDEEGFLYVIDRRTDLIISGGENIYPSEVESALLAVDGVVEAAVIGATDETWGQIPVAFIVRKEDELCEDAMEAHLKKVLASYKIPKQFFFVECLPKNASNKVMRHKLLDWID